MKISTKILDLLEIKITEEINVINDDFTIDWNQVDVVFENIESKNLDNFDDCLKLKRGIDPIIKQCLKILDNAEDFISSLAQFSVWTFAAEKLIQIFKDFCKNPEENSLAGVLQLTSIVEFSLGNVYKAITRQLPPHLLKDLLEEMTKFEIFQFNQIFILQILVGTSNGVNLRNVAWHGFLESLDPAYLSFLLVIITSYGKQLQNKLMIANRLQDNLELSISLNSSEDFDDLLNFESIKDSNIGAWKNILNLFKARNCISGVFLILTQLEGLLRKIYGEVNEIDVTAQVNKYYVIMDSMFYGYVLKSDVTPLVIGKITKVQEMEIRKTCKRNKMLEIFPCSLILLYHDLFYGVEGPRIRDKLSHGEVIINEENSEDVLKILLQFTRLIIEFYDQKVHPALNYESCFMTSFQFRRNFNICFKRLKEVFEDMEIPKDLERHELTIKTIKINSDDIKISFLPIIEAQAMKLLLKISENFKISLDNFQSSTQELFELFNLRKLSSGRREMLKHLIESLPNLSQKMEAILKILHKIFFIIQSLDDKFDNEKWSNKLIKLLKQILKLTENLVRYFSTNNRNYHVANERIFEFIESTKECDSWLLWKFNNFAQ